MSKLVKCSSCNIVLNEVLAFICNKIDVMTEESISRICVSAFTECDIVVAKQLLYDCLPTSKTMKQRKRSGKVLRDIDDIVCLLKETNPQEIPIFAARDLQKLPPVLFDHVDVTSILKDLVKMRNDIDRLQQKESSSEDQINTMRTELEDLKKASIVNNFSQNVNKKRGAGLLDSFEYNSGPMGLAHVDISNISSNMLCNSSTPSRDANQHIPSTEGKSKINSPRQVTVVGSNLNASCAHKSIDVIGAGTAGVAGSSSHSPLQSGNVMTHRTAVPALTQRHTADRAIMQQERCGSNAEHFSAVLQEGEWKAQPRDENWVLVQRRKLRNRFVGNRGTATVNTNFKAADIKVPVYIYNVAKETTVCDVSSYITKKTNLVLTVEKMNMKMDKDYVSYKIFVPSLKVDLFLKSDFWPEGVAYRRFVNFGKRRLVTRPSLSENKM